MISFKAFWVLSVIIVGCVSQKTSRLFKKTNEPSYNATHSVEEGDTVFRVKLEIELTNGWFAFGFSSGGMLGADMAVLWWNEKSQSMAVSDRMAFTKDNPPAEDVQNGGTEDWRLTSSSNINGILTATIERDLVTGDARDNEIFVDSYNKIIFAVNNNAGPCSQPGPSEQGLQLSYHTHRGSTLIAVGNPVPPSRDSPDIRVNDYVNENWEIPSATTTYVSKNFLLDFDPAITGQRYAIRFEPVIDNVERLHHMILFGCRDNAPDPAAPLVSTSGGDSGMPTGCGPTYIFGWAVGGGAWNLPNDVHFEVGEPAIKGFIVNFHYDNQVGAVGQRDSSGIRVYHQDIPRTTGFGFLVTNSWIPSGQLGPDPQGIPAGKTIQVTNRCEVGPGESDMTVFAYFYHMHQIGRKIWQTFDFADGRPSITIRNDFWDFNIQETIELKSNFILKAGDTITSHCVFDSSQRTEITIYGDESVDEMCLFYLAYHPRRPLASPLCRTLLPAVLDVPLENPEVPAPPKCPGPVNPTVNPTGPTPGPVNPTVNPTGATPGPVQKAPLSLASSRFLNLGASRLFWMLTALLQLLA